LLYQKILLFFAGTDEVEPYGTDTNAYIGLDSYEKTVGSYWVFPTLPSPGSVNYRNNATSAYLRVSGMDENGTVYVNPSNGSGYYQQLTDSLGATGSRDNFGWVLVSATGSAPSFIVKVTDKPIVDGAVLDMLEIFCTL
jgi:hypothetical protein